MAGTTKHDASANVARRRVVALLAVGAATGAVVASRWFNIWAEIDDGALGVAQAHAAAMAGDLLLVDIRRPDEWALTGVGEGAVPIDMRRQDFETVLLARAGGNLNQPIALICARGVRSRHLAKRLSDAGFAQVLDVPEGMLGSGAGPGWLAQGLPVIKWG